ncbi:hemerythrin domain-containing protein [Geovibrio thiophilus]|uniref:Hemerythrin domain-containing protein n=1 Tax=Geovibrio thiophilus TaxID=139438 RepID=A0A410K0T8_9BACT|nr:hemerythrin domain-containing protein [Geovibrio thiophilus]QAR33999.1 hemerythrin domain-containing protein [Geovibrio thiophilus]
MSALITELKNDHLQLLKLLQEVQITGLGNDAGRKKLLEGKRLLAGHLQKEDTRLYPALKNNPAAKNVSDQFADEMKKLTAEILGFINRMEKAELNMEYAKDLGRIITTLRLRINREEIQLYPLYDKVNS